MIELINVSKFYNSNSKLTEAIKNVNLSFNHKGITIIKGKSGSGKTTLLKLISGDTIPDVGVINKNDVSIIQSYQTLDLILEYSVLENICLPLYLYMDKQAAQEKALSIISQIGMSKFKNQKVKNLSGGQRARVSFARTLISNNDVVVFDEPTAFLDKDNKKNLIALLNDFSKEKTIIVACHDFEEYEEVASRVIELENGIVKSDSLITKNDELRATKKDKRNIVAHLLYNDLFRHKITSLLIITIFLLPLILVVLFTYNEYEGYYNVIKSDRTDLKHVSPYTVIHNNGAPIENSYLAELDDYEINPFYINHSVSFNVADSSLDFYYDNSTYSHVKYGRLPENDNEVVLVSREFNSDVMDYVGSKLTLPSSNIFNLIITGVVINEKLQHDNYLSLNSKVRNYFCNDSLVIELCTEDGRIFYNKFQNGPSFNITVPKCFENRTNLMVEVEPSVYSFNKNFHFKLETDSINYDEEEHSNYTINMTEDNDLPVYEVLVHEHIDQFHGYQIIQNDTEFIDDIGIHSGVWYSYFEIVLCWIICVFVIDLLVTIVNHNFFRYYKIYNQIGITKNELNKSFNCRYIICVGISFCLYLLFNIIFLCINKASYLILQNILIGALVILFNLLIINRRGYRA